MFKKQVLLVIGLITSTILFAQSNNDEDKVQVGKYTIKIITNHDNTYGYEIFSKNELIARELSKSYQNVIKGFNKKENALKVARYHMQLIESNRHKNELLKRENIESLRLTSDDFISNN